MNYDYCNFSHTWSAMTCLCLSNVANYHDDDTTNLFDDDDQLE